MRPEEKRRFKDEIFAQFARIGKALSSGRRLELLELLTVFDLHICSFLREEGGLLIFPGGLSAILGLP
jgi:hypothetical protein